MDKREHVYFDGNELTKIIRAAGSNLNEAAYKAFFDENTGTFYCNYSGSYLYKCCKNGKMPFKALEKICAAYNIPIEDIALSETEKNDKTIMKSINEIQFKILTIQDELDTLYKELNGLKLNLLVTKNSI